MTIDTRNGLIAALPNAPTVVLNKASVVNAVAGQFFSLWRATGSPGQGAIPGAVAVLTNATAGGFPFTNPTDPVKTYLGWSTITLGTIAGAGIATHDRLSAMGGLSGIVTTAQTVNVDVSVATSNMVLRKGLDNYSEVQWWLEWYTDTGATTTTPTVAVTYDDNSTANISLGAIGTTIRAGRIIPIVSTTAGRYIKSVQSVTLSATTGTAGSFGVTATRPKTNAVSEVANKAIIQDWASLGFPRVDDSACLMHVMLCSTTSTGTVIGQIKLPQG